MKRALGIIANILLYMFMALCLLALVLSVFSKKSDGAVTLFGKIQMRIVVSPSMEKNEDTDVSMYKVKSIPVRSMVFIRTVPETEEEANAFYDSLQIGDVLTFRYVDLLQDTVTHRLIDKQPNGNGGYILSLRGDNVDSTGTENIQTIDTDDELGLNYVVGKVTGKSVVLGNIVYAVQQPVGMALLIIVPCAIIAVGEAIRIGSVLAARKRERAEEESRRLAEESLARDTEIEQLRRQLSELTAKQSDNSVGATPTGEEHTPSDTPAVEGTTTVEETTTTTEHTPKENPDTGDAHSPEDDPE